MRSRLTSFLVTIPMISLVMILTSIHTLASTSSPSPAPSKTPTPIPEPESTDTVETSEELPSEFIQPFTQSDLSVLTGNVQRPNGAVWHNDRIYAVCTGDWTIYELEDDTGSTQTYIYGIRNGHTLYIEDLSETEIDIWVPDYDTNTLLQVNRSRAPQSIATNLQGPWGIAYLDEEHFLITNLAGNNLVLVNRDGEVQEVVNDLRSPTGIAVDEELIYVANNGSARRSIEWISKDELGEGDSPTVEPLVTGLQNTTGVVFGPDELLYFAYALGTRGVVGRVDPEFCREQGGCTNEQVEIVLYTELAAPLAGLTISPDKRLFVHTIFRPEIYWVQLEQEQ
jgi:hypothetical protein